MTRRRWFVQVCIGVLLAGSLAAQTGGDATGDGAVAEKYVQWSLAALEEGRWAEAEQALERAGDFADVSSDASYLLALVRFRLDRPLGAVLEAARRAGEARRWSRYGPEQGLLLEARALIALRSFADALDALSVLSSGADADWLRAMALQGLPDGAAFRRHLRAALEAYPMDPRFARLVLEYAARRLPGEGDRALVDTVLKRLPVLAAVDPALGYLAAPFVPDVQTRRRMVAAYRALGVPEAASIPAALELGLIDDDTAIAELYSGSAAIEAALVRRVWLLLRGDDARQALIRAALAYSGALTADADRDGRPEARVFYRRGELERYDYDGDQDGIAELSIEFADEAPRQARVAVYGKAEEGAPARPAAPDEPAMALVRWQQYPLVEEVELRSVRYVPGPGTFAFAPVRLDSLLSAADAPLPRYPEREAAQPVLTERSLVSFSAYLERPSPRSAASLERIDLLRGIPQRLVETRGGQVLGILEFERGRPIRQRLDADADGRLETRRRFDPSPWPADGFFDPRDQRDYAGYATSSESDWDGDGKYEYGERRLPDGGVEGSWDLDGDGVRERVQRIPAP